MHYPRSMKIAATALCAAAMTASAQFGSAQTLNDTTSWIGNSFPGTPNRAHIQNDISALYVGSDGTCYTDSIWDEGSFEAGIYKGGAVMGSVTNLHGWGRGGAHAVTADSNYVYTAITQTGDDGANTNTNSNGLAQYPTVGTFDAGNNHLTGQCWYAIKRTYHNGAPAPFSKGYGVDGDMLIVNTVNLPGTNANYPDQNAGGLAVNGTSLFVGDPANGKVKIYNLSTLAGTPVATWTVANAGPMAFDGSGNLWIVQTGSTPKVLKYNTGGSLLATITFASGVQPSGVAYNPVTGYLLVSDQGPNQNVKEYNIASLSGSPTATVATLGATGGIYSGARGQIGLLRFNNPTGVGADSSGNIYVSNDGQSHGGGTVLESYTAAGARNWVLNGLEFVDNADIDPGSENDVYTKEERFSMNWGNTTPGSEATYSGYTIDPFTYPQDARLHMGNAHISAPFVRRIQGKLFLFVNDMYSSALHVFRFNSSASGEIAIPATSLFRSHLTPDASGWPNNQPASGEGIWRDGNGNGAYDSGEYTQPSGGGDAPNLWCWWVDSKGDIWQATQSIGVRHFAFQGLDSSGNPIYDYAHMTTTAMPSQFNDVERIQYDANTDTMYLTGYSASYPNPNSGADWGLVGRVVYRYDHWSSSPSVHSGYPIVLPFDDTASPSVYAKAFCVAGSYLFTTSLKQTLVQVYRTDNGALVGNITPGASVGGNGNLGWTDIPYGVRAYQRTNGEYEIFNEDDLFGKVVMYRWSPTCVVDDNVSGWTYSGTWGVQSGSGNGRYAGTWHESNTSGAYAQYSFTGTSIALTGEKQPYGGTATVYIDGVSQGADTFNGSTAYQQTIYQKTGLTPGVHTIKVVSNGTGWIYVDAISYIAATAEIDDNASSGWAYSNWTLQSGAGNGRYANTWRECNTSGGYAQYTFTGTAIGLIGEQQPYAGSATIYLDGVSQGSFSFYSASSILQQPIWGTSGLPYGSHTLKVVNNGTGWTYIDAVTVSTATP